MGFLIFLLVANSVFKSELWREEWGGSPDSTPSRPTVAESYCHLQMPSNLQEMSLLGLSPLLNELLGRTQRATAAFSLAQHGGGGQRGLSGGTRLRSVCQVLYVQTCSTAAGNGSINHQ